jgi:hypothetical protein
MLAAERYQCPRQQETEWSVVIHHQAQLWKYWALVTKRTRNKIDTKKQANEILQHLPEDMQQEIQRITNYQHPMIVRRECQRKLRIAIKYQTQLLKIHRELRHQGLLCLQEIRIKEGNLPTAEIIRKIIRHELHNDDLAIVRALRNPKGTPPLSKQELYIKQWQTINPAFHTQTRSSLNTIDVPYKDEDSQPTDDPDKACIWQTITDPMLIEEKLLARNIAHFGQADGTLFTTRRFQELFGYGGITTTAKKFGRKPFNPNDFPPLTKGATTLLSLLSNNNGLPEISTSISQKEFAKGFKKWSEGTSTSPSGRHLGHYRCLLVDDDYDGYTEEDPDPSDLILGVYYKLASLALKWGISLERWQNSITTMIEKQPGCPRINKLRVIHLYKADYNLLLKIIWARRLLWHAHDMDRLNEGQAGSTPGRNSINVVI